MTSKERRPGETEAAILTGEVDDHHTRLAEHHLAALAASGITPEHAGARGYETITESKRLAEVNIVKAARDHVPGLLVPQLHADGSTWGYQYRPDNPRLRDGKPIKYETPWQQRNGLDVPPGVGEQLGDPSVPLWITEGVKKADCGALQGLCVVALSGVWNWIHTSAAGSKMALPEFREIELNDRRVILAFDGDVVRKPAVQKALHALAQYLGYRGAKIEYLHLPDTDDKTGLDDYLVDHNVEDLWRLVKPTQPPTVNVMKQPESDGAERGYSAEDGAELLDVDGAELLDDVQQFAGRFVAFPTGHHITVLTLWAVHTWAVSAFYVTPRLVLDSPEPGCAKTRVLEVLALLCCKAKLTLSTTTAALYRRIAAAGDQPPTVLQDEADAVFGKTANPQVEDLRALFNAGYKRGATVDRCEGDAKNMRVVEFPVFAPVALAGLAGKIPKTILDRAVVFHMRHRAADEHIDEFRERDAAAGAAPLTERLAGWAAANFDALAAGRPKMPDGVRDRSAEVWEALIAVADVAGGNWPQRARDACKHFVLDTDDEEPSLGIRLLRDLRELFNDGGVDAMFSVDIITALTADEESEWCDLWGKPLDQRRLAKELRRYGVRSRTVRSRGATSRGYHTDGDDGLAQAWRHYLDSTSKRHGRHSQHIAAQDVSLSDTHPTHVTHIRHERHTSDTPATDSDQPISDDVSDVLDVSHIDGSPADADAAAAYRDGMCRDCKAKPHSPGRSRCDACHRIWQTPTGGYEESGKSEPRPGFRVTGPDRCGTCGFHIPTQGHRDDCTDGPASPALPPGGITEHTPGMTDRVQEILAKQKQAPA